MDMSSSLNIKKKHLSLLTYYHVLMFRELGGCIAEKNFQGPKEYPEDGSGIDTTIAGEAEKSCEPSG